MSLKTTIIMLGEEKRKVSVKIAIGDADALIALVYEEDSNHTRAKKAVEFLTAQKYEIIYPNTAILEAITALKRAKNLPEKAHLINRQYQAGTFTVEFIDELVQRQASIRFEKTVSKKNTIFDCIVIETAIKFNTRVIFSFDDFFTKQKFQLAGE